MERTKPANFRLTKKDRQHIASIIRSGRASNATAAIRVALYEAANRKVEAA